ncbi:MAG: hypothetical protein HY921_09870 [Elusimicrobia bacterium]|nr:hypothetical protein [Elusimicrobiota bacterium]
MRRLFLAAVLALTSSAAAFANLGGERLAGPLKFDFPRLYLSRTISTLKTFLDSAEAQRLLDPIRGTPALDFVAQLKVRWPDATRADMALKPLEPYLKEEFMLECADRLAGTEIVDVKMIVARSMLEAISGARKRAEEDVEAKTLEVMDNIRKRFERPVPSSARDLEELEEAVETLALLAPYGKGIESALSFAQKIERSLKKGSALSAEMSRTAAALGSMAPAPEASAPIEPESPRSRREPFPKSIGLAGLLKPRDASKPERSWKPRRLPRRQEWRKAVAEALALIGPEYPAHALAQALLEVNFLKNPGANTLGYVASRLQITFASPEEFEASPERAAALSRALQELHGAARRQAADIVEANQGRGMIPSQIVEYAEAAENLVFYASPFLRDEKGEKDALFRDLGLAYLALTPQAERAREGLTARLAARKDDRSSLWEDLEEFLSRLAARMYESNTRYAEFVALRKSIRNTRLSPETAGELASQTEDIAAIILDNYLVAEEEAAIRRLRDSLAARLWSRAQDRPLLQALARHAQEMIVFLESDHEWLNGKEMRAWRSALAAAIRMSESPTRPDRGRGQVWLKRLKPLIESYQAQLKERKTTAGLHLPPERTEARKETSRRLLLLAKALSI